jgi:hypothetical protein
MVGPRDHCDVHMAWPPWFFPIIRGRVRLSTNHRSLWQLLVYRGIRPWLTSTFEELIVYCCTILFLSKKITSDFLSPSAPL